MAVRGMLLDLAFELEAKTLPKPRLPKARNLYRESTSQAEENEERMSLADDLTRLQEEDAANRERQHAKCGDYTGDDCPNCRRQRVMRGEDGKRRCEKCCWCIEDDEYDGAFLDYMH